MHLFRWAGEVINCFLLSLGLRKWKENIIRVFLYLFDAKNSFPFGKILARGISVKEQFHSFPSLRRLIFLLASFSCFRNVSGPSPPIKEKMSIKKNTPPSWKRAVNGRRKNKISSASRHQVTRFSSPHGRLRSNQPFLCVFVVLLRFISVPVAYNR